MAVSIYTDPNQYNRQFQQVVQKDPYNPYMNTYAGVGMQQQKRRDDILTKFEDLGTSINNIPEDQDFAADAYSGITGKINKTVDGIASNNMSTADALTSYLDIKREISSFESPFGKQAAASDRFKTDQANKIKATTAAGDNQHLNDYYNSLIRADARDTPVDYKDNDWNRLPERNFQKNITNDDINKKINTVLTHQKADLRSSDKWGLQQDAEFETILEEEGIAAAVGFIESIQPTYGKSNITLTDAINQNLLQDSELQNSITQELAADKYNELLATGMQQGNPIDHRDAAREAEAWSQSTEAQQEAKDRINEYAISKGDISSQMTGGALSVRPLPLRNTEEERKKRVVEKQIIADLKITESPKVLIPGDKEWDYEASRNKLSALTESIAEYDKRLKNKEVLTPEEIRDYRSKQQKKLSEEYWLDGLTKDYIESDGFLVEAAEKLDNQYRNLRGYSMFGKNGNASNWIQDDINRDRLLKWARGTMFLDDPTLAQEAGQAIRDFFPDTGGDAYNTPEIKKIRVAYGDDLRDLVNTHVQEFGNTGMAMKPMTIDVQYYDETTDGDVDGSFTEHANDIQQEISQDKGASWDVLGGPGTGGVIAFTSNLSKEYGVGMKVTDVKALKQQPGQPFQALATWKVDEEAYKNLPDEQKEAITDKNNIPTISMIITPIAGSNIGDRLVNDQKKAYREAALSTTFQQPMYDEADMRVANYRYGKNFAPALRLEQTDSWKTEDNNVSMSIPVIFMEAPSDESATGSTNLMIRKTGIIENRRANALLKGSNIDKVKVSDFEIIKPVYDDEGKETGEYEKLYPLDGTNTRAHSIKDLMLNYYRELNPKEITALKAQADNFAKNRSNIKIINK